MLTLLHPILRVLCLAVFAASITAWADPTAETSPRVRPSEAAASPRPSTANRLKIKIPPGVVPHHGPKEITDLAIRPHHVHRVISVAFLPAGSRSWTADPLWAVFAEGSFPTRGSLGSTSTPPPARWACLFFTDITGEIIATFYDSSKAPPVHVDFPCSQ